MFQRVLDLVAEEAVPSRPRDAVAQLRRGSPG